MTVKQLRIALEKADPSAMVLTYCAEQEAAGVATFVMFSLAGVTDGRPSVSTVWPDYSEINPIPIVIIG